MFFSTQREGRWTQDRDPAAVTRLMRRARCDESFCTRAALRVFERAESIERELYGLMPDSMDINFQRTFRDHVEQSCALLESGEVTAAPLLNALNNYVTYLEGVRDPLLLVYDAREHVIPPPPPPERPRNNTRSSEEIIRRVSDILMGTLDSRMLEFSSRIHGLFDEPDPVPEALSCTTHEQWCAAHQDGVRGCGDKGDLCIACMEEQSRVCMRPCMHMVMCYDCYAQLDKYTCPLCRESIDEVEVRVDGPDPCNYLY